VNAALLLRRWNALDAMAAGLVPQELVHAFAGDRKDHVLETAHGAAAEGDFSIFHPWSRA